MTLSDSSASGGPEGKRRTSRREFLAGAVAAAAAPYFVPASALGRGGAASPSERIGVGVIGVGGRGGDHVRTCLGLNDCTVLGVCDPFQSKREAARKWAENRYAQAKPSGTYKGCEAYGDFRELLARDDIDAVFIASPENWHALQSVAAARAGKDVYCEKALSLTIAEGRAVCEAVRRYGRVFQIGTQQRSWGIFRFACELARNGYVGKLHTLKVSVPGGQVLPNPPPMPVPPGLDYDMWLGPAPFKPYNDIVCTFNWYFVYDYCVGWIESWGVHYVDVAQWGCPGLSTGTIQAEGSAVFPPDGLANTSVTWRVEVTTPDGVRMIFVDDGQGRHGVRFEGDKGWVFVNRGGISAEPASLLSVTLRREDEHLYRANDHHENFFRCVRSRKDPSAPVEAGHTATTLTIVSDIATRLRRKVTWDWAGERFVNDEEANRMTRRSMRSPWVL